MLFIETNSQNPYFNLAAEEYLVQNKSEEIFMLWRNSSSVIIGRNQNALSEIDYDFITENSIPVVRRMSGGGAVFHDEENLNYTYIINCEKDGDQFGNYEFFTKLLCDFLKEKGVLAYLSGRNDILVDGRKISGNAQYKCHGRLMHHGTILVGADMARLSGALTPDERKVKSKGIKSVKSRVANINEFIDIDAKAFFDDFKKWVISSGMEEYSLTDGEVAEIKALAKEKYETYEWNFGYSPKYDFRKKEYFPSGSVEVCLKISNGIIEDAKIFGDFFSAEGVEGLENALKNKKHEIDTLREVINVVWKENMIGTLKAEDFIKCLF